MKFDFLPCVESGLWDGWIANANHWFSEGFHNRLAEKLVVVSPHGDMDGMAANPDQPSTWGDIHSAWRQIKKPSPGARIEAWRVIHKHGDEIAPNLGVFRIRAGDSRCLFWLSPYQDLIETQARLADLMPTISAYWHIMQERGLFHAAGILHKGRACLFVGVSGAGKSTVSSLSSAQGDQVIHDDHVIVYQGEAGMWSVTDAAHTIKGAPIKAIFFLVQDQQDRLLPINTARTAKGLIKSLHEHGKHALFGEVLQNAFSLCSDVARKVPGFELHFRKSPDFWKLIDEQFPE